MTFFSHVGAATARHIACLFHPPMNQRRLRCLVLLGLVACASGAGCSAAADLGARAAVAVVEGALKAGNDSAANAPPDAPQTEPSNETPCRKKLREWREADGNPRADPPPHLRCGPKGEWPDESEVLRPGSTPGL